MRGILIMVIYRSKLLKYLSLPYSLLYRSAKFMGSTYHIKGVSWYGHNFSARNLSSSLSAAPMKESLICAGSVYIASNLLDSTDPFGGNPQFFRKIVSTSLTYSLFSSSCIYKAISCSLKVTGHGQVFGQSSSHLLAILMSTRQRKNIS